MPLIDCTPSSSAYVYCSAVHSLGQIDGLGSPGAVGRERGTRGVVERVDPIVDRLGARVGGGAEQRLHEAVVLTVGVDSLREGVPLNVIQRQLGHRNLGATSIYPQGIDPDEIIDAVHARRPSMISASVGLALPPLR